MTLTTTFLLVFSLATVAVDDSPKKDDAESLKGTWKVLSVKQEGQNVPERSEEHTSELQSPA